VSGLQVSEVDRDAREPSHSRSTCREKTMNRYAVSWMVYSPRDVSPEDISLAAEHLVSAMRACDPSQDSRDLAAYITDLLKENKDLEHDNEKLVQEISDLEEKQNTPKDAPMLEHLHSRGVEPSDTP
jgi:hypothetical protein